MIEQTLSPLGVVVTGVEVGRLEDADIERLVVLLADHGVVVMPAQEIDDAAFAAFLRRFGDPVFTAGETPVDGYDDLNVISNVGRETPPRSTFHVDTSYVARPPAYTALRAVTIPEQGGETIFTDQYAAYDTLPYDVRERLAGRTVSHVVTGVDVPDGEEVEAEHPVFRTHPVSGRTSVYLTTPARCAAVSGLDDVEARQLLALAYAHSTRPENSYRHRWAPGDVVMWDNGCVLHRADHEGVVGDRVMHRGMATGYADR